MNTSDIRWIQRFNHFKNAFSSLQNAVMLANQRALSELEEQGLIQAFEYTHELAWNTLRDFLKNNEVRNLYGSKDTTRAAFRAELIGDGEVWMDMIKSRNLTSHTYNEEIAAKIASAIIKVYFTEFKALIAKLDALVSGQLE